jgi:hypothetical protein
MATFDLIFFFFLPLCPIADVKSTKIAELKGISESFQNIEMAFNFAHRPKTQSPIIKFSS